MQQSSNAQRIDHVISTLRTTASKPADPLRLEANPPDVWVAGGILAGKTCVFKDDVVCNGTFFGNLYAETIEVDRISEAFVGHGITFTSNVYIQSGKFLQVQRVCAPPDQDLVLCTDSDRRIVLDTGSVEMACGDVFNISSITNSIDCTDLTITSTNIVLNGAINMSCGDVFNISSITNNNCDDLTITSTNIVLNGQLDMSCGAMVNLSSITNNGGCSDLTITSTNISLNGVVDMSCGAMTNLSSITNGGGCSDLTITSDNIVLNSATSIDMSCGAVVNLSSITNNGMGCNDLTITANTIILDGAVTLSGNLNLGGDVDFACGNLHNISSITNDACGGLFILTSGNIILNGIVGFSGDVVLIGNVAFNGDVDFACGNVFNISAITNNTCGNITLTSSANIILNPADDVILTAPLKTTSGGTGLTSYTAGDILTYSSGTSLALVPIGTDGQSLTVVAGAPSWQTLSTPAASTLGTIITSMLTEVQFQVFNGVGWVLMDGRNVVGSAYNVLTGFATIPDARGTTLRGKNNGRVDGFENPSGDLALGTFQNDQFQGHYHTNDMNAWGGPEGFTSGGSIGNGWNVPTYAETIINDGSNGVPRFGPETRMKAITINYFIKID